MKSKGTQTQMPSIHERPNVHMVGISEQEKFAIGGEKFLDMGKFKLCGRDGDENG